jgi:hypothetical protein
MLACVWVLALIAPAAAGAGDGENAVPVREVVLEEIDAHELRVHLRLPELPATTPRLFVKHRTVIADRIVVDTGTVARVDIVDGASWIRFNAPLAAVPEDVLALPIGPTRVRWEGVGPAGDIVLAAHRIVDPRARRGIVLRPWNLFVKYGRVTGLSVWPSMDGLRVEGLLLLYNPMAFPVTIERIGYEVEVAGRQLLKDVRDGFVLGAHQVTEVPIEETVAVSDALRSGLGAVLGMPSYRVSCELHLRTSDGTSVLAFSRHNGSGVIEDGG